MRLRKTDIPHLAMDLDTGMYRFRLAVPPELVKAIGKTEIKKALGTDDKASAIRQVKQLERDAKALFAQTRAELAGVPAFPKSLTDTDDLSEEEAQRIAAEWRDRVRAKDEVTLLTRGPLSDAEVGFHAMTWPQWADHLRAAVARNDLLFGETLVGEVIERHRLSLFPHGIGYRRLCRAMMLAAAEVAQERADALRPVLDGVSPKGQLPEA